MDAGLRREVGLGVRAFLGSGGGGGGGVEEEYHRREIALYSRAVADTTVA